MPEPPRTPDAEKLRVLADWFDAYDYRRDYEGTREVQADLRAIADRLDELAEEMVQLRFLHGLDQGVVH